MVQLGPLKPAGQRQVKPLQSALSMQVAPLAQGLARLQGVKPLAAARAPMYPYQSAIAFLSHPNRSL